MGIGILYALGAGLLWGLVFVGPLIVPDYPAALQSAGRYVAFGLVALPLAWHDRARLRGLHASDWIEATRLTLVGNLLYYFCLASAIQRTGAPVSTMIIGTLPVVMSLSANWLYGQQEGHLPWKRLALPLLLILSGLLLVNLTELRGGHAPAWGWRYASGLALAVLALGCWTWYPLRNARWMRAHPDQSPTTWATAQGLVTLPLACLAYGGVSAVLPVAQPGFALPLGPRPLVFAGLMLTIGLLCSWLGTLLWNAASQRLPTTLLGPMIVFETLSALAYAFVLRQEWPALPTLTGIACLIAGVTLAMRIRPEPLSS